jgi:pilus assembly protein TadC
MPLSANIYRSIMPPISSACHSEQSEESLNCFFIGANLRIQNRLSFALVAAIRIIRDTSCLLFFFAPFALLRLDSPFPLSPNL